MISCTVSSQNFKPFDREKASLLSHDLSRFEAAVMILDGNRAINAKSLLGLLSFGYPSQESFILQADGFDEEAAMARTLQCF